MLHKITEAIKNLSFNKAGIIHSMSEVQNVAIDIQEAPQSIFWQHSLFHTLDTDFRNLNPTMRMDRIREYWLTLVKPAVTGLVKTETRPDFMIDLRDLAGITSSKSTGNWQTLEEFGRSSNCAGIARSTEEDFENNTNHSFPARKHPLTFYKNAWDDRIYWSNDNGSHHAAAAHVQAIEQNKKYILQGKLRETSLSMQAAIDLSSLVQIILAPSNNNDLTDRLHSLSVEYSALRFRGEHEHLTAFLFPKDNRRSVIAADALIENGAADFNLHISECVTQTLENGHQKSAPGL